jgi:pimeloyl-ACP methyl ester carboxylesterase
VYLAVYSSEKEKKRMNIAVKLMRWILIIAAGLVGLYFVAALVLTFWPGPNFSTGPGAAADESGPGVPVAAEVGSEGVQFTTRDGAILFARQFGDESPVTVLLLHGVAADSSRFVTSADALQHLSGAQVLALDLRGHGQSGGKSGDIAHLGQYEEDVADVVAAIRSRQPDGQVVLAGHSMGGGIALRYALLADAPTIDGHLLYAPHLGTSAPTMPAPSADGASAAADYFLKLHIPRILGLTMLNAVGICPLNGLPTMFFNLPPTFTRTYSYRAMASSSPADYRAVLEAVDAPMLVLVGSNDEAFVAEQFPPTVAAHSAGEVLIIDGETHDGIYNNPAALAAAQAWMDRHGFGLSAP